MTTPAPNRSPRGIRTLDMVKANARAAELHSEGRTWSQVAEILGVSERTAARMAERCRQDASIPAAQKDLAKCDADLDYLETRARETIESPGPLVSAGKVIPGAVDMDRRTRAIDALRRVLESRRRLHGWDAPARSSVQIRSDSEWTVYIQTALEEARTVLRGRAEPVSPLELPGDALLPGERPAPPGGWVEQFDGHPVWQNCGNESCDCYRFGS